MSAWICRTCAVQQPDTPEPPGNCPICDDERQYVGWGGQQWTTMAEIARDYAVVVREEEPGLTGIGLEPAVAIGQRALLVRTPHGVASLGALKPRSHLLSPGSSAWRYAVHGGGPYGVAGS